MPMIESNEIPWNRHGKSRRRNKAERKEIKFLISSSAEALAMALAEFGPTVTVEAEYGDQVVEGSVLTLAHHGSRSGNPCPCLAPNMCAGEGIKAVGLSHLDLDALGGCMSVMGCRASVFGFWDLAAFIDMNGPHKLAEADTSYANITRLQAWWAWSDSHRITAPRDGSVADVTQQVIEAMDAVKAVIHDDVELIEAGWAWVKELDELNASSFVEFRDGVIARVSGRSTNSLYITPTGKVAKAVVALDPEQRTITVSFADKPTGPTAIEIVQGLWGPEAGGHAGIAGSPRNRRMTREDLSSAFDATIAAL